VRVVGSSRIASVDALRIVEASIGSLLLLAACVIALGYVLRLRREHERARSQRPRIPALKGYEGATTDPRVFGGGAKAARVGRRRDVVSYGYLGVAEEYADEDSLARWCTLSVRLPGRVPYLVVDRWDAIGRPDVPAAAPLRGELGDPHFDATYVVGAEQPELIGRVLGPVAREVLVAAPLQRLALRDSTLLLRTLDGVQLSDKLIAAMVLVAERFLASTPSFVTSVKAPVGAGPDGSSSAPLPEGLYGPDRD
jgi:hypothetical protein